MLRRRRIYIPAFFAVKISSLNKLSGHNILLMMGFTYQQLNLCKEPKINPLIGNHKMYECIVAMYYHISGDATSRIAFLY